jgi:hypothetical protein
VTIQQALFIAPCSHAFHFKCLRPLLDTHYPAFVCPLCRTFADLEADVEVEADEWEEMDDTDGTGPGKNKSDDPMTGGGAETEVEPDTGTTRLGAGMRRAVSAQPRGADLAHLDEEDEDGARSLNGGDAEMADAMLDIAARGRADGGPGSGAEEQGVLSEDEGEFLAAADALETEGRSRSPRRAGPSAMAGVESGSSEGDHVIGEGTLSVSKRKR